jgi:Sporulation protein and related proteins
MNECSEILGLYSDANLKNKETLDNYKTQVSRFETMINSAAIQVSKLEESIAKQEEELSQQQNLLSSRVRRYYIHTRGYSALGTFLTSDETSEFMRSIYYQQQIADKDKKEIEELGSLLANLIEDRKELEQQQKWLAAKKKEAEEQVSFLAKEVAKAEDYINVLSNTIATLSAKQKALLTARSGTFTSSVGDVPVSNIPCSGPPGSPSYCSPGSGWFGAFSFGAWTHRKGMSQYGAKGRAESGQSVNDILQAYYGKTPVNKDTSGAISVIGIGSIDFEGQYLMGIAEMPSNWHPEALKAQAIAARTYAYRYKSQGTSICTTQACQVYSPSKAADPPPAWRQAVEATRGQVLEDVITYYSSTSGGYLTTSGWDTTDGNGGEGFASRAWESIAGSPWFYSGWYTENYSSGSATCGRSSPWLSSEEMADILNAWEVLNHSESDDRILPITINSCPIDGITGNPYSMAELREKGGFTSVSSVSVAYSNDGYTSTVSFGTNKGSVSVSGEEFKKAFNLRAPGYISIRSPLFNIEKS